MLPTTQKKTFFHTQEKLLVNKFNTVCTTLIRKEIPKNKIENCLNKKNLGRVQDSGNLK